MRTFNAVKEGLISSVDLEEISERLLRHERHSHRQHVLGGPDEEADDGPERAKLVQEEGLNAGPNWVEWKTRSSRRKVEDAWIFEGDARRDPPEHLNFLKELVSRLLRWLEQERQRETSF